MASPRAGGRREEQGRLTVEALLGMDRTQLARIQRQCDDLGGIIRCFEEDGEEPEGRFPTEPPSCWTYGNLISWMRRDRDNVLRYYGPLQAHDRQEFYDFALGLYCLPRHYAVRFMEQVHARMDHADLDATLSVLHMIAFYPGMRNELKRVLRHCAECRRRREEERLGQPQGRSGPRPSAPPPGSGSQGQL